MTMIMRYNNQAIISITTNHVHHDLTMHDDANKYFVKLKKE